MGKKILIISVCLLLSFLCAANVAAENLPLDGATAYDPDPETDLFGWAWAFSTGTINPTAGQINHNSCAIIAYLGLAGIGVIDGIRSDTFTVETSGQYKLHISGFINGELREGSSASFPGGVSKSGGKIWLGGGFTCVGLEEELLYETDFSTWAVITEMAWATWTVFLDQYGPEILDDLLLAIKDALTPNVSWDGDSFNLYSYAYLEAGVPYRWAFYVASSVGAGGIGLWVKEAALYEADIYGLSVNLTYLGDESIDPPTGVIASDGTYTDKVRVIWNNIPDANAYDIYRSTSDDSNTATKIATNVGSLNNLYDDTSAVPEQVYYYWVRSKKYDPLVLSELSIPDSGFKAQVTGSLTVTIDPPEVTGTVEWRLTSGPDTSWKESGNTISDIPIGNYTLQFNEPSGWLKPYDRAITISEESNSESGTYIRLPVISSIAPTSGPPGTYMKIDGEYFGSSGSVIFSGGATGEILDWTEGQILCKVPNGAADGDMIVRKVESGRDADSDGTYYDVTNPTTIYVDHVHTPDIENGTITYPFSTIERGVYAATNRDEVVAAADTYTENVYVKTGVDLHFSGDSIIDGQVTTESGSDIISDGSLTITGLAGLSSDVITLNGLSFQSNVEAYGVNQTFDAGTGTLHAMGTITKGTAGDLTIEAANDITLGGQVEIAGTFTLTADSDANGAGDVQLRGHVTLTSGNFTSSGVDFGNPNSVVLTTGGDIGINHNGIVTLWADLNPNGGTVSGTATHVIIAPLGKIQDGIDVSVNGADVMVKPSTYTGVDNRDIDFKGKAITVRSESGPENCIIDCQQEGRGFIFYSGEDSNSVLDGFTITNGTTTTPPSNYNGGGIYCDNSSPTISNCIITGNAAIYDGGGMYYKNSNSTVANCTISENINTGLYCEDSNMVLTSCTFIANYGSAGIYFRSFSSDGYERNLVVTNCNIIGNEGSGINFDSYSDGYEHNIVVIDCNIIGNEGSGIGVSGSYDYSNNINLLLTGCLVAYNYGPGTSFNNISNGNIANCTIVGNFRAGIRIYGSECSINNCLIAGNYYVMGSMGGGGIQYVSSNGTLTNSTIVGNFNEGIGGGIWLSSSDMLINNCIFWENIAGLWGNSIYLGGYSPPFSTLTIGYSNMQDGQNGIHVAGGSTINWGSGNIDSDPLFVSPGYWDWGDWIHGDYHLLPDSPCIDTGDPNYITDANDFDIDGNPRVIGGRVDIGADEYNTDKFPDLNGDGIVNFEDFAMLAYSWNDNTCSWPDWCQGSDLDESGMVDFYDGMLFIEHWLEKEPVRFHLSPLDADPGWATTGEWAFGEPTSGGGIQYGNPDPTSGYTRANVCGVNLNGDYDHTTTGGPYYLTTGPFDCNNYSNVSLKFARWLNTDDPAYVKSTLEVSSNGTLWTKVWEHTERSAITDDSWRIVEYDISSVADEQETVYIRWGYEILEDAYPYSGWNIDDIQLWGNPLIN